MPLSSTGLCTIDASLSVKSSRGTVGGGAVGRPDPRPLRVSDRAVLEIVAGREQAAGGLPVSLPAGMETIDSHCQDAFDDYEPYVDSQGNVYRYGYGLRD
jgi:hypothetical protein